MSIYWTNHSWLDNRDRILNHREYTTRTKSQRVDSYWHGEADPRTTDERVIDNVVRLWNEEPAYSREVWGMAAFECGVGVE